jgi:hypothetical protein
MSTLAITNHITSAGRSFIISAAVLAEIFPLVHAGRYILRKVYVGRFSPRAPFYRVTAYLDGGGKEKKRRGGKRRF